ncbi:hypothetical protein Q2941_33575 [Bradyrhizobium sp. UFLA05-153]
MQQPTMRGAITRALLVDLVGDAGETHDAVGIGTVSEAASVAELVSRLFREAPQQQQIVGRLGTQSEQRNNGKSTSRIGRAEDKRAARIGEIDIRESEDKAIAAIASAKLVQEVGRVVPLSCRPHGDKAHASAIQGIRELFGQGRERITLERCERGTHRQSGVRRLVGDEQSRRGCGDEPSAAPDQECPARLPRVV